MCGLTGIFDPLSRGGDIAQGVAAMTARLQHRGPDDDGLWVDAEAGLALGHRRLSIVDLSPEGHQPMASHGGRYVIAFNGEIYNFRSLRAELVAQGHVFRGGSDTARSEEQTSELQSLMRTSYSGFCLTKKKNDITTSSP